MDLNHRTPEGTVLQPASFGRLHTCSKYMSKAKARLPSWSVPRWAQKVDRLFALFHSILYLIIVFLASMPWVSPNIAIDVLV